MTSAPPSNYDRTGPDRQRRARERGRQVSALLNDAAAIARWDALVAQHGSQRAALESLLTPPASPARPETPGSPRSSRRPAR